MLEALRPLPADPILGLMAKYRSDGNPRKVDLGVGVYKNEAGHTPVLGAVKRAEAEMLRAQASKTYVGPLGNVQFNQAIAELALGPSAPAITQQRLAMIQTPGGCGALRLVAELVRAARPEATVWVSDPTWGNHMPLLGNAGLRLRTYPYLDPTSLSLNFSAMVDALQAAQPGDLVLLHACCHNPTGVDLSPAQWRELLEVVQKRSLVPFIDMAYQGFGEGLDQDARGLRLFAEALPEVLFAVSCSKNFGLYRERVGAAGAICAGMDQAQTVTSHFASIARGIYSMPPDHGAAIVAAILENPGLTAEWREEVDLMRGRIDHLRKTFSARMRQLLDDDRFAFIERQVGMFSYLGITPDQVRRLAADYGIYMLETSRTSIAGLNESNIDYVCRSLAAVVVAR